MTLPAKIFLVFCVAICDCAASVGADECEYDLVADLNIQILNRSTQIPIDNDLNNWNGTAFVREGKLIPIVVWGYRVDFLFRDVGKQRYEVMVVLQKRTSPADTATMFPPHNPNATYEQLNSTALKYEGVRGTPLVIRPDIGEVTLDLTIYPYPKDAMKAVSGRKEAKETGADAV